MVGEKIIAVFLLAKHALERKAAGIEQKQIDQGVQSKHGGLGSDWDKIRC